MSPTSTPLPSIDEPEPDDDSEDEWEEIVEPSGENPDDPADPTKPADAPTYGATSEEDWHPASESPPAGTTVDVETSGEVVPGYKADGVWYTSPEVKEDGSKTEPVAVQCNRWRPIAKAT